MPFMRWVKTQDGYKPVEMTDEEVKAQNFMAKRKNVEIWLDEASEMEKREKEEQTK